MSTDSTGRRSSTIDEDIILVLDSPTSSAHSSPGSPTRRAAATFSRRIAHASLTGSPQGYPLMSSLLSQQPLHLLPRRRANRIRSLYLILLSLGSFVVFFVVVSESASAISLSTRRSNVSFSLLSGSSRSRSDHLRRQACNPFQAIGRLQVDLSNITNNRWEPYDTSCASSSYMGSLYRGAEDRERRVTKGVTAAAASKKATTMTTDEYLPWLVNRTVIIQGDSIDRYHLKDFCSLVKGTLFLVDLAHPASPAPYRQITLTEELIETEERRKPQRKKEERWETRPQAGQLLTNPWVCDIEEYGATFVSVFTFGLQGSERFFGSERWYHPPESWKDRFQFIMLPLLKNLAIHLGRPQIEQPDLIEINSGFWDLRQFTEEDFFASGYTSRPYPEDVEIPYHNLGRQREIDWEKDARRAIKSVARSFPGLQGETRSGPPILWRTLHHPLRHNYAPYNRVFALDSLARKVVRDLQDESIIKSQRQAVASSFLIQQEEVIEGEDLGLDVRLRVDEWGALMLGQEHHFVDLLHPSAIPGSYIWGDIILYELRRAVLGSER